MEKFLWLSLISFLLCFVATWLAWKIFPKLNLLDRPWKYGLKRKPIPYYGGLVIFSSFWFCAYFFIKFDFKLITVFIASLLLVIISFLDDFLNLKWYLRLATQFLVAIIVILAGLKIFEISNPFGGAILLNQIKIPFMIFNKNLEILLLADLFVMFWMVIMMNAMNWMDGVNGLPSGITVIAALVIFVLSTRNFNIVDQTVTAYLSIILASCCLAFAMFDFYPAKILMGDTGSMFLGFMLAVLAVFSGAKIATTALVFGFPLLDFVWIIFRRIFIDKKSPFKGDLTHIHHRFLKAGLSERQTLLVLYLICASFGAIALFTQNSSQKLLAIFLMILAMIGFGAWVYKKSNLKFPHGYSRKN
ncbi:MAG: glycosyl transferase, family 4, conserved region, UDP-N-acetylglucosamine:undecaprenyl-P N-acetylglucosaminyl 1-P transferase [Candidatus Peregrinibacteria bacterium GW2011_GWF2_33_10]|nr:MAG: glycosyl transferase, family 4, conserved region, UDP-N-acetylglucosamine:undecaprenyl-P N-acetylglucosaminyl 1-P transferase [Candidatus Peregrinibacteria bacterium GW2011_GWF2_33_10]OGJ44254.1 MAG: hypothetical protein A2272_04165 [Candidatus Peregrinibacteria bacterium RIFOXYA12_FULL_33_12]OGJ44912.1 MAG: hypothetical protein A2263_03230 [Candidatus Peregrinibacteria bacterium RIFOXYA2_FULL_33_21]OGJ50671.1 MAG: hypothetical protein A2307_03520 [Candidatus Peregrinibacteria bacterium 